MPPKGLKNIAVSIKLWNRLNARKRPHQAMPGVIEELLEQAETKQEGKNTNA